MAKTPELVIKEAKCACGWKAPYGVRKLQVGVILVWCERCRKKTARVE